MPPKKQCRPNNAYRTCWYLHSTGNEKNQSPARPLYVHPSRRSSVIFLGFVCECFSETWKMRWDGGQMLMLMMCTSPHTLIDPHKPHITQRPLSSAQCQCADGQRLGGGQLWRPCEPTCWGEDVLVKPVQGSKLLLLKLGPTAANTTGLAFCFLAPSRTLSPRSTRTCCLWALQRPTPFPAPNPTVFWCFTIAPMVLWAAIVASKDCVKIYLRFTLLFLAFLAGSLYSYPIWFVEIIAF